MTTRELAARVATVGKRIEQIREGNGIETADLARRAGIARSTLQRIEHGQSANVSVATLLKIADALKVRPGELV